MTGTDGAELLTTAAAGRLLATAVEGTGGALTGWRLDHVDSDPGRTTTATYRVEAIRSGQLVRETVGLTVRAHGLSNGDHRAKLLQNGGHAVVCWFYPDDPDLPGLARATDPVAMAGLIRDYGIAQGVTPPDVQIELIGYRPRRRAVLRVAVRSGPAFYVKVLRASHFEAVAHRHRILAAGGLPSPRVLATTSDSILAIAETPGTPLARAIFTEALPVSGSEIVALLDSMPAAVVELERRPPWASSVRHYARIVESALPDLGRRLGRLTSRISQSLAGLPPGEEPTHGDFYEAQVFVAAGHVSGLIDIDTIGPGRRADDLACLVGHLHCIQRMTAAQERQAARLVGCWLPAFDDRVDPVELRLRAAAVVISLATGPYRGQELNWESETRRMIAKAEELVAAADALSN
ncbi:MAG: aminoglycoside phosphotransferase family protein [Propionibacteriaceae bacterium]|jgi:hypothetical protein|nr:aminoglycoside phosphotransferase family protein [Propionibacteriaceae bacterium]